MRRDPTASAARAPLAARHLSPLVFLSFVACADLFGINDTGSLAGTQTGGSAGKATSPRGGAGNGTAGTRSQGEAGGGGEPNAGGAAGTGTGSGGRSGEAGDAAGEGGNDRGHASGGEAGMGGRGETGMGGTDEATGGTGEAGTSRAGMGGAGPGEGGAGGSGEEVVALEGTATLGATCEVPIEDTSCSDATPSLVLQCDGGVWSILKRCDPSQRCVLETGKCDEVDYICWNGVVQGPTCDQSQVVDCSPDLYTTPRFVCPFGCQDGACDLGGIDDLTIHTGSNSKFYDTRWEASIPVCLADAGADAERLFATVRAEVETTWNRYLHTEFTGWGKCEGGATGVVVSFADDCRGRLTNDAFIGRPTRDRPVSIEFCASYYDPAGHRHETEDDVLRLVARHQFGHALGLEDGEDPRETFMLRGANFHRVNEVRPARWDYWELEFALQYYRKQHAALVTPHGSCLSATGDAPGAGIQATPCEGAGTYSQSFMPVGHGMQASEFGLCVEPNPSDESAIELGDCPLSSETEGFRMAHAQWRTPYRCVAPMDNPPVPGTPLITEACQPVGEPSQAWFFEITVRDWWTGAYRGRIHFGESGYCATLPRLPPAEYDIIELEPCTATGSESDQLFLLHPNGRIETWEQSANSSYLFVSWRDPDGVLYLYRTDTSYTNWLVTGAIENAAGAALTLDPDGTVTSAPLAHPPLPSQIFDFYF